VNSVLGPVHVGGHPIGPDLLRHLRRVWADSPRPPAGFPHRHMAAWRHRMSILHATYRTKTRGRR
jgi:hypothetical protein